MMFIRDMNNEKKTDKKRREIKTFSTRKTFNYVLI